MGGYEVLAAMEEHLGIKTGEGVTPDGLFSLQEVECLGACVNAPMFQVNNHEFYEDLTPENAVQCLKDLAAGNAKVGPQPNNQFGQADARFTCEGPEGKTCLTGPPSGPYCRDLSELTK